MAIKFSSIPGIKSTYSYDPETGVIFDQSTLLPVTSVCAKGIYITVNKQKLLAHRVAYYLMTGLDPEIVKHIDGDMTNNKWDNLVHVKRSSIARQPALIKGARWNQKHQAYQATAYKHGKQVHLGFYASEDDAKTVSMAYRAKVYDSEDVQVDHIRSISGWSAKYYIPK